MKTLLACFALLLLASPAFAQELSLGWPAACELNQDCWVAHYVDHDGAQQSYSDFGCGRLTYDGHDGTDIAIRDRSQQVDVVAAADGVVTKMRNGERDHNGGMFNTEPTRVAHTECGNAVMIDHGHGWRTLYCHMKEGSVVVQPGQQVSKGDKLGEVGQSGLADFPHVHLSVFKDGKSIDPYTGDAANEFSGSCGTGAAKPLWDHDIPYDPVELYASGFSEEKPDLEQKSRDTSSPETLSSSAPTMFFWFLGFGGEQGDNIHLQIIDAGGKVVGNYETVEDKSHIRIIYFVGLRNTGQFAPGPYRGVAMLTRTTSDGQTIQRSIEHSVTIE